MGLSYKDSGVDIEAGNRAVSLIKKEVESTFGPEVLGGLGSFGGLFAPDLKGYREPVFVAGTDGVGTKLKIAFMMDRHSSVGIDLVAMCVNDILAQGAKPLFFLDYLASGKLEPQKAAELVKGIAAGCREAGCALIGGETAELPGFYQDGEYDLAGFAVGIVDRAEIIDGSGIKPGDCLIGLASNGLHSNGFSLVRKVLFEKAGYNIEDMVEELGKTLGEELLKPTRIYVKAVMELISKYRVKGLAHITGGGLLENIPRILPRGRAAVIKKESWPLLPVFELIAREGRVSEKEMFRTFNIRISLVLVVDQEKAGEIIKHAEAYNEKAYLIGEIVADEDPDGRSGRIKLRD